MIILWLLTTVAASAATKKIDTLPSENAVVTIERSLSVIAVTGDVIIMTPQDKPTLVVTPFNQAGKNRSEKFGVLTDSKRYDLKDLGRIERISGMAAVDDRLLIIDGDQLMTYAVSLKDFKFISKHSIVLDLIKPASDSRGEPTSLEISKTRTKIKNLITKFPKPAVVGLTRLPDSPKSTKYYFLVATRYKGFPVVKMSCSKDNLSRCKFERQCFLSGRTSKTESIRGIAMDHNSGVLLLGDEKRQLIEKFRYNSCYHIAKTMDIALPEKVFAMTNFTVGSDSDLWFTTDRPDNYYNSSAFQVSKSAY